MSRRNTINEDLFNFIDKVNLHTMMPQKVDEDVASTTSEFVESLSLIEKCQRLKEENERLREKLDIAKVALTKVSQDYYNRYGTIKDWPKDVLEVCVEHDTLIAQKALKELEGENVGFKDEMDTNSQ